MEHSRLEQIVAHTKGTRCGETADFISAALYHNWTDLSCQGKVDYFCPNASNKLYIIDGIGNIYENISAQALCEKIREILTTHTNIMVTLDYSNLDHGFNICKTDKGLYIVDSYVAVRSTSMRLFDLHQFKRLLDRPSLNKWNNMFLCQETTTEDLMITVFVELSY